MIRLIVFLILVTALGFAFAWVADRPGEISLVWQGMRYQTSLMVAVAAFVALVVAIMLAWWAVMTVLRSPTIMRRFLRDRRRDRGYSALSRGLIAAGSGDPHNARRLAQDSRKLLGSEPLVELLDAQTLLLEGEHGKARERFEAMREDDGTKLVALRGLYLEAEREGAREAARHYAKEAVEAAPSLAWAGNARLRHLSADGDWPGALAALETMRAAGTLDKAEAARKRAVLLTAEAMSELRAEPEKAARLAREAHRLAVDLVPAAVTAATALVRSGELRKAAGILEATWKKAPHPDIADAYVHLRSGDSVRDRLKRARKLAGMQPDHVESRFAVAEAAVAATEWKAAREALRPVLEDTPTRRACLVMADIEEGEFGDRGRMRDWLSRAVRAPLDPVWMADGMTSERWLPISPVSGRLDAFEWKTPVGLLAASGSGLEITESDLSADSRNEHATDDEPAEGKPESGEADDGGIIDVEPVRAGEDAAEPDAGGRAQETESAPGTEEPAPPAPAEAVPEPDPEDKDGDGANIFPLKRRPDDPGIDPDEPAEEPKNFRLF